jgi:hypothetical protein
MTEAAKDRCWNCGMMPKRWLDVTSRGLMSGGFSARTALGERVGRSSTTAGLDRRRRIGTIMRRTGSLLGREASYSFGPRGWAERAQRRGGRSRDGC